MLSIRQEQLDALRRAREQDFQDRMVEHLRRHFPVYAEELGDAAMRAEIWRACERARTYGLRSERDLCLYIDVVFAFGRDFDLDPALPWAAEILAEPGLPDPSCRINRLVDTAIANADQAHGIIASDRATSPGP